MTDAAGRVGLEPQVNPEPPEDDDDERPALTVTRRNLIALAGFLLASLAALYFLAPQLAGLDDTWARIEDGRPVWTIAALLLTFGMFGGYVAMFRGVFVRAGSDRLGWRASYQITMAGLAASRLFAAGGAGGLVLTAWALRRSGMRKRTVADKTISFLVLTYLPYVFAVIVCGFGLHWGLFSGEDPFSLTFVPAVVGVVLLGLALAVAFVPTDLQRRLRGLKREGRLGRLTHQLAIAPASTSAGIRDALDHLRSRDPALLGAVLFWAFQIAVLWAAFHAFGNAPAARRARAVLLHRHARQPAADAGRRRRGGGRYGRRLLRVRRGLRPRAGRGAGLPRVHVLAPARPGRDRVLPAPAHGRRLEAGACGLRRRVTATLYKVK